MTSRERFERALRQHLPLIDTTRTLGAPYVSLHVEEMWQLWQVCEAEMRDVVGRVAIEWVNHVYTYNLNSCHAPTKTQLIKIIDEEMSR